MQITESIKNRILYNLDDFEAYDIANVVWALGKLQCEKPNGYVSPNIGRLGLHHSHRLISKLLNALEARAVEKEGRFQPQGLSNCLWSMATLQHQPSPELIQVAKERLLKEGTNFDAQSVSNTMWAFAKLEILINEAEDQAFQVFAPSRL